MATCNDDEGWVPVSRHRPFDLTSCFEEGIVLSSLSATLVIASLLISLHDCLKPPLARSLKSRWILRGKLSILLAAFVVSVVNVFAVSKAAPVFESYVLEPLAFIGAASLTYVNHTRSRRSSTMLLVYWPISTLGLAIWIRSNLIQGRLPGIVIILKTVSGGLGLLSLALECIGPEIGLDTEKSETENPTLTANVYSLWTFAWLSPLMRLGAKQTVVEDDLPSLRPEDESEKLGRRLEQALKRQCVIYTWMAQLDVMPLLAHYGNLCSLLTVPRTSLQRSSSSSRMLSPFPSHSFFAGCSPTFQDIKLQIATRSH